MKSCTVDRGCTPAPKDATKLAVFFRFFRVFPLKLMLQIKEVNITLEFSVQPLHLEVHLYNFPIFV